jgi:diacylglycerol kinase (ATP)
MPETPAALLQAIAEGRRRGVRRFIVGGGDGTLSLAAGALLEGDGVLGVLPLGTGNTFAAGLGLPARLEDLAAVLADGVVARYDVGEAASAGFGRRVFLYSVTLGVRAHLAELLTPEAKRRFGRLAWPLAVRAALRATPPVRVRLTYDGGPDGDQYVTRQLIVANGRTVAGPIVATPSASAQDALLDVYSLGRPSARLVLLLLLRRHIRAREAHYRTCREVEVWSEPAAALDVDGEVWGSTPVRCRVLPAALRVLVPRA